MAHLIRPWQVRYLDKSGRRVPKGTPGAKKVRQRARKWYGAGVPGQPPRKRFPLATDRGVAQQKLAELVRRAERGEAGLQDSVTEARVVALETHLADYAAAQRAKPKPPSAKQLGQVLSRLGKVFAGCGFALPGDMDAGKVNVYLAGRRALSRKDGGVSTQTSNFYLAALGQFCRWMVKAKRLAENPFLDVVRGDVRLDRRHDRRPLKPGELERLFSTVRDSPRRFRGLSGADRCWLYHVGCATGFRSSELASLTPASFDLDAARPAVVVAAVHTKNKRKAVQRLPRRLAPGLRDYLAGRSAVEPVWPGTWPERAAKMLRRDLEDAGLPYVVAGPDGPLFADFHALRHTYVTMLSGAGATPKDAQTLARHSDPRLTLGVYTHSDDDGLGLVVDRLALPGSAIAEPSPAEVLALAGVVYGTLLTVLLGVAPETPANAVAPRVAPLGGTNGDRLEQNGTPDAKAG